jgi:hypothetical protein
MFEALGGDELASPRSPWEKLTNRALPSSITFRRSMVLWGWPMMLRRLMSVMKGLTSS